MLENMAQIRVLRTVMLYICNMFLIISNFIYLVVFNYIRIFYYDYIKLLHKYISTIIFSTILYEKNKPVTNMN